MTDKHTPGDWHILSGPEWGGFTVSGLRLVATMCDWGVVEGEAEANARLITEAPAMLAALRDLLAALEARGAGGCSMDQARAILARIDGEA